MRAFLPLLLLAAACNPNSIGRPCVSPDDAAVRGTQVSSPALECPSRLCLIQPGGDGGVRATCTADCAGDGDCAAESSASCPSGFACAVATATGPYCCRPICVCRDDVQPFPSCAATSQAAGVIHCANRR